MEETKAIARMKEQIRLEEWRAEIYKRQVNPLNYNVLLSTVTRVRIALSGLLLT